MILAVLFWITLIVLTLIAATIGLGALALRTSQRYGHWTDQPTV